ncbi:MAG: DUF2937 family protein [Inquilinaceae bacterium]
MALTAAIAFSQLSAYADDYVQNLSGRLAEARRDVAGIVARADDAGVSVYAYLQAFREADNPIFVAEGRAVQAKIDRAAALARAHNTLIRAGGLERPLVLAGVFDGEIGQDTWTHFRPSLAIDKAGIAYAGAGLVLAVLAHAVLETVLLGAWRRMRRRPQSPGSPVLLP